LFSFRKQTTFSNFLSIGEPSSKESREKGLNTIAFMGSRHPPLSAIADRRIAKAKPTLLQHSYSSLLSGTEEVSAYLRPALAALIHHGNADSASRKGTVEGLQAEASPQMIRA
jgi:hypothetical protein